MTSPVIVPYAEIVANDLPYAWWPLTDATGSSTVADASGNGWTATPNGSAALGAATAPPVTPGNTSGQVTPAANGFVSSLTIPSVVEISVECWFNMNGLSNSGQPFLVAAGNPSGTAKGFQLFLNSGNLSFVIGDGAGVGTVTCPTDAPTTGWVHAVGTWDGQTMALYQNGSQVATTAFSATYVADPTSSGSTLSPVGLGYNSRASNSGFNGYISQCAVYNYALLPSQVTAHWQSVIYAAFVNLCPNPSITTLTGYAALPDTGIAVDTFGFFGSTSLLVETDGIQAGEGIVGPSFPAPATGMYSVQMQLYAAQNVVVTQPEGNLTLSIFANPANPVLLGSEPIDLSQSDGVDWMAISVPNLSVLEGQEIFFALTSTVPQILAFNVDAVAYQPYDTPGPYIDGDGLFCDWAGTPGNSASYQLYENMLGGAGQMDLFGSPCPLVDIGFQLLITGVPVGNMTLEAPVDPDMSLVDPVAAFNDFSCYLWNAFSSDLSTYGFQSIDPAQSYVSWNNAGTSSGHTNYARIYGIIYAPLEAFGSNQVELWPAAQYMSSGYQFTGLTNGQTAEATDLQVELAPYIFGAATTPSTFDTPRNVHTIVKPTRLNFCPSPTGQGGATPWYLVGGATSLTTSSTNSDAFSGATSGLSIECTLNTSAGGDGIGISLTNLIWGDIYSISAWIMTDAVGLFDVSIICSGVEGSSFATGDVYGGGAYGDGPYGGINTTTDMTPNQWYNPQITFTAQHSTVQLYFQTVTDSGTFTAGHHLFVDAVLVEAGEETNGYFDGGFGTDYSWETGGSPGLTRSYFYERSSVAENAVQNVITQHNPVGITASAPLYSIPYTQ